MLNYENDRELKTEIMRLMREKKFSLNKLGQALGISTSALSQWQKGDYKGDNEKINEVVRTFIKREYDKAAAPKIKIGFVETTVAKKILEALKICHLENEISVCYGDAGIGKTTAVTEYVRHNTDVLYILANLSYTTKVLFAELHQKLGMDGSGSINSMLNDCLNKLRGSNKMIIIDQAEYLPSRSLDLLRALNDEGNGAGIFLVGLPRLVSNVVGKRGELKQLFSRIGITVRLETISAADVEKILVSAKLKTDHSELFFDSSKRNTRALTKLINRAHQIAQINEREIDERVIAKAASTLIV
ncbi:MAG: AAA family ATPase [Candidatus Wallbacteria bacterium]